MTFRKIQRTSTEFLSIINTVTTSHSVTKESEALILFFKPAFHLQQTPRPRDKKQNDYVVEQSSFPLIALSWLKIGRCRGRNWLYGNRA